MIITIPNEGHTLGYMLQYYLARHEKILNVSYSVSHPAYKTEQLTIHFDAEDKKEEKQIYVDALQIISEDIKKIMSVIK